MKKCILIILINSLALSVFGQIDSSIIINTIKFRSLHSFSSLGNAEININNFKNEISCTVYLEDKLTSDNLNDKQKKSEIKNIYEWPKLTLNEFNTIVNAIRKIDIKDVYSNINFDGADGSTIELEFGNFDNTIKFSLWSPNYNKDKRKLTDFVNACTLIIKAAKLNPQKVF